MTFLLKSSEMCGNRNHWWSPIARQTYTGIYNAHAQSPVPAGWRAVLHMHGGRETSCSTGSVGSFSHTSYSSSASLTGLFLSFAALYGTSRCHQYRSQYGVDRWSRVNYTSTSNKLSMKPFGLSWAYLGRLGCAAAGILPATNYGR